jgi:hypothetical protein
MHCFCFLHYLKPHHTPLHRFDLLHVMLDELTEDDDGRIAAHIVALHKDPAATIGRAPFSMEQLQRYIKYARAIKPRITTEVRGLGADEREASKGIWRGGVEGENQGGREASCW